MSNNKKKYYSEENISSLELEKSKIELLLNFTNLRPVCGGARTCNDGSSLNGLKVAFSSSRQDWLLLLETWSMQQQQPRKAKRKLLTSEVREPSTDQHHRSGFLQLLAACSRGLSSVSSFRPIWSPCASCVNAVFLCYSEKFLAMIVFIAKLSQVNFKLAWRRPRNL